MMRCEVKIAGHAVNNFEDRSATIEDPQDCRVRRNCTVLLKRDC